MSYFEQKKKKKDAELKERASSIVDSVSRNTKSDIAPLPSGWNDDDSSVKWHENWFQKGAFEDGYDFGDVTKTILGTFRDVEETAIEAVSVATENIIDTGAEIVGRVGGWFGNKDFEDRMYEWANGTDLFQSEKTAKTISNAVNWTTPTGAITNLILGNGIVNSNADEYSVLDEKADSLVQSAADMIGAQALKAIPGAGEVVSPLAMFNNAYRAEMRNAYANGATVDEAQRSAVIAGAAELIFEQFGGMKIFKGAGVDDIAKKWIAKIASSKLVRTLMSYGFDIFSEGFEEVATEAATRTGQYWNYLDDNPDFVGYIKNLTNEEALQSYIDAAIGGAVMGFAGGAPNVVTSIATGRDTATNLTANEEAVVKKVYEAELAEAEKKGEKVNKNKLWDSVVDRLKKGNLSIDKIQEVLGDDIGNTSKEYMEHQVSVAKEDAIRSEYDELGKKVGATLAEQKRFNELGEQIKTFDANSKATQERGKALQNSVKKYGYLIESYSEEAKSHQKFEFDEKKFTGKQLELLKKVRDSDKVNNTRNAHEEWEFTTKVAADMNLDIEVMTEDEILEVVRKNKGEDVYKSLFDESGKLKRVPQAFITEDGKLAINVNSRKASRAVVGHEICHALEKSGHYEALSKMLNSYGKKRLGNKAYGEKLADRKDAYKDDKETTYDKEMTADLLGEFIFDDGDFIEQLSVTDQNVFQRVWNEVTHLWKMATAGTPQKAELERIKHKFEKAYREIAQKNNSAAETDSEGEGKMQMSFSESVVSPSDAIQFNYAFVEDHKEKLRTTALDKSVSVEDLIYKYDKIVEIWDRLGGELNSEFLDDWNNKKGRDRAFTLFKSQAGYKYNIELSSMCKKGVPLFEAIDKIVHKEIMNELGMDKIGKEEKEILYNILKAHDFEIPCAICYVEQARQREGTIINDFLNGKAESAKLGWNQVLTQVQEEMAKNGTNYSFASVDRAIATDKYSKASINMDEATQDAFYSALQKLANDEIARYNKETKEKNLKRKVRPLLKDVTPESIKKSLGGNASANLKIFNVLFTDSSSRFMIDRDLLYSSMTTQNLAKSHQKLYSLFNQQGGVSGYKTKQTPVIYVGDVLAKKWRASGLRMEGGVRNQSNSDHQMYTLLDQAQMYIDFTAKGYYMQAYTKVLSELKLLGLSNAKINASLIPKVLVYRDANGNIDVARTMENAGLDENGELLFDDVEGINHNEAFMLIQDPEYSKSVGGVCIGYSDNHILKMLDDDRIQLIIGFHDKTNDPDKRYHGAKYSKNYNGENEAQKVGEDGKTETVHIGFNNYVQKAEKMFSYDIDSDTFGKEIVTFNGKEYGINDIPNLAADLYLADCAKKGILPAYSQGETDFSKHRNYYKLLADFSLRDSEGNYAPHKKVSYNMPDKVPYLDGNGVKQYEDTYKYIKKELKAEMDLRAEISEALSDTSEEGIIPQFKAEVQRLRAERAMDGDFGLAPAMPQFEIDNSVLNPSQMSLADVGEGVPYMQRDSSFASTFYTPAESGFAPVVESAQNTTNNVQNAQNDVQTVKNPFARRDYNKVGNPAVKSFVEENPEVQPFFQESAKAMLEDLRNSQKGEPWYNEDLYRESGGEVGLGGVKRETTEDIAYLVGGKYHYTYQQIDDALNRIINGDPLNACAKRVEFALNDRLLKGYTDINGNSVPANQEYIALVSQMPGVQNGEYESGDIAPNPNPSQPQGERGRVAQIRAADKQDNGTLLQRTKKMFNDAVSLLGDKGMAVENLSRKIGDIDRELQASYEFMRNRSEGQAQAKIETELKPIMEKADATGNRALFDRYAYSLHHIDRMSLDSEDDIALRADIRKDLKGFSMREIERLASENIGRKTPKERADLIRKAQLYIDLGGDKGKNKSVLGDVTKQEAIETVKEIESKHPEFKAIEDELIAYNRGLLQDSVDAGLITQKQADLMVKLYPHYVPVVRLGKNGNSVSVPLHANRTGVNSPFKRATGGNSDMLPVFEATAQNTGNIIYAINRNEFGQELFEALEVAKMIDANELVTDKQRKAINRGGLKQGQRVIAHDRDNVGTVEGFNPKTGKYAVYFHNKQGYFATADIDAGLITPIGVWDESAINGNEESDTEAYLETTEAKPEETNRAVVSQAQNGMPPQFTIFVNGKRVTFDITPEIYDSMVQNDLVKKITDNPIVDTLNKVGKARRAMLTKYDPFFALARNPARDVLDVFTNSRHAYRTYKTGLTKTHKEFITKGKYYQEFYENGGFQNSSYDRRKMSFKKEGKIAKFAQTVLKPYETISDTIEQYWRLSEYIASREQGKSIKVALLDSARVTTNFGAGGDVTKAVDRAGGMFINPSVQGLMQNVRNFREAYVKGDVKASVKNYAILGAKLASLGIVPMLANLIFWDDDEDYEELSDYVKQNYHIVGKTSDGKFIRIPKGRMQAVMQNAFEQITDAIRGKDEIDFQEFGEIVANNLGVNNPIENNLWSPIKQAFGSGDAGETWYGEDLVPTRLQNLPDEEQYDESTDEISKFIGKVTKTSPYKWNYLLDQYGAGVADLILPMLTEEAEGENFLAPIRDEFVSDPLMKNQNVSDFYELKDELTVKANGSAATDEDLLKSSYMNAINSQLSELYKMKREIQSDTTIPDSVKYSQVREIQQKIVEISGNAMDSYEDVNIQGSYATVGDVQYRYYTPGEDSTAEPGWRKLSEEQIEKQNEVTRGLNISASEYWSNKEEYDYAYETPGKYAVARAVGGYKTFRNLSSKLNDIKSDKDSSGKTVSGSRKKKVVDYINGLDLDYGEKIILYKSEYNSDDTYNNDIVEYLNSRKDLSYKDIETILKELGFIVDANGNIYWD